MTAQALIAGSGLTGFSESGNARIGSVNVGTDTKNNSFDKVMSKKVEVNNSKQNIADSKSLGKKITINNSNVSCKDGISCNDQQSDNVNLINVSYENGEIKVNVVQSANEESVEFTGIDIDELLELVKKYLQEENEISDEDFEKAMAECGFTMIDLFKTDNLQQFFVELNGMTDFSEILTNDSLLESWNSLVQSISEMEIEIGDSVLIKSDVLLEAFSDDEIVKFVKEQLDNKSGNNNVKVQTESISNSIGAGQNNENVINTSDMTEEQSGQDGRNAGQHTGVEDVAGSGNDTVKTTAFNENLFETFLKNIQESVAENERFDSRQIQLIRDVAFQIVEGVKVNVKADTSSLEMALNPESLGKVNVAIEMKDGVCTANFVVRNELARIAVESQLQTLKETFEERGLKVDAVEVNVSDFSFNQNRQTFSGEKEEKSGDNKIRITRRKAVKDETEELEEVQDNSEQGIDLTA